MPKKYKTPLGITLLSPKEMVIIRMLLEHGETYGLDLVNRSKGEIKRGTVYVTLGRMEDPKNLVESRLAPRPPEAPPEGPSLRLYKVTEHGRLKYEQQVQIAKFLSKKKPR